MTEREEIRDYETDPLEKWFEGFRKLGSIAAMQRFLTERHRTLPGAFGLLSDADVTVIRERTRDDHTPGADIPTDWHPVARAEAIIMNRELASDDPQKRKSVRPKTR